MHKNQFVNIKFKKKQHMDFYFVRDQIKAAFPVDYDVIMQTIDNKCGLYEF